MDEEVREWCAAPIWFIPQQGNDDCGGATLLTLAAFHLARAGTSQVPEGGQSLQEPYKLVSGEEGSEAPCMPGPRTVFAQKLKPNNLVTSEDWACDPMGLWKGLRQSVEDFGYPDPNWMLMAVPADPSHPGPDEPLGASKSRGAEETLLARIAWQITNLGQPAALGYRFGSNLHWVTAYGIVGVKLATGHIVAHGLLCVDPQGGECSIALDRKQSICVKPDDADYWQNQLIAVCVQTKPPRGGASDEKKKFSVRYSNVDLLPVARANTGACRDPRALPIAPADGGPYEALRHLYSRRTWYGWIARHAKHNSMVDRDVALPLGSGAMELGPPLPIWGERSEAYSYLLPLLEPGPEPPWRRLARVVEMDHAGLVSQILPPGSFREFFRDTPLLDPSEPTLGWPLPGALGRAGSGPSFWIPPDIPSNEKSKHRLLWPRARPVHGSAVPVIQPLEMPPGVGCLDHQGQLVTFLPEVWG